MKNGEIILVTILFATLFFANPVLKMSIPNFGAEWGSKQDDEAANFFNLGTDEYNKKIMKKQSSITTRLFPPNLSITTAAVTML